MLQKDNLPLIHASEGVGQLRGQGEELQGYSKRGEGSSPCTPCATASQISNFAAGWSTSLPRVCGEMRPGRHPAPPGDLSDGHHGTD